MDGLLATMAARRLTRVAGALTAGLVLAACGGSSSGGQATNQDKTPIKIGVLFSITGAVAEIGKAYNNTTQMAIADLNAKGGINGRQVQAVYEDAASDPTVGVTAARKLIDRDGVNFLMGDFYSPVALAEADLADKQKVVFFSPGATANVLTTPVRKYVFVSTPTAHGLSVGIADFIASMSVKKIGMIAATNSVGEEGIAGLTKELGSRNLSIASTARIAETSVDATSQVLQMKNASLDAIVVDTSGSAMPAIINALWQQKTTIPIIAYGGGASAANLKLIQTTAPLEYYAVTPLACPLGQPCTTDYVNEYKSKFNADPNEFAAEGYVAMQYIFQALKKAKTSDPDSIVNSLETAPSYQSKLLPFPVQFTKQSHLGVDNTYLQGYKNGKLVFFGNDIRKNKLTT